MECECSTTGIGKIRCGVRQELPRVVHVVNIMIGAGFREPVVLTVIGCCSMLARTRNEQLTFPYSHKLLYTDFCVVTFRNYHILKSYNIIFIIINNSLI